MVCCRCASERCRIRGKEGVVDGATVKRLADAVRTRDFSRASAMLKIRPELVNMELAENDERRALHFAVLDRSSEMVRLLMRSGANARKGIYPHRAATTALTLATERGYDEIVAIITDEERQRDTQQRSPDASSPPDKPAAANDEAMAAVRRGDFGWLRARHAEGLLVNAINDSGALVTAGGEIPQTDGVALF